MPTIYVPAGFSWVAASLLSVASVLQWQGFVVAGARKAARIPYPQAYELAYAEKAEQESSKEAKVFNCVQRAHQNTLENAPVIVLTTLIAGVRYPIPAAVACGLWSFTRIIYTLRYGTGEPRKRVFASRFGLLTQTLLTFLSGKVAFDLIKAGV